MIPIGDVLASFGSRLAIVFDPVENRILLPRYGEFDEIVADLAIGIRLASGKAVALPFTRKYPHFEFVEQLNTMNSIAYIGYAPEFGVKLTVRFTSPFYPQDARLSTAPFLLVDFFVEQLREYRWRPVATEGPVTGELFFEIRSRKIRRRQRGSHLRLSFHSTACEHRGRPSESPGEPLKTFDCDDLIFPHSGGLPLRLVSTSLGFVAPFDLNTQPAIDPVQLTWCAFTNDKVLEIFGRRYPFKYLEYFADENELIRYAILERFEIARKSSFFDSQFRRTELGKSHEDLMAFSFHSFALNTWWTLWKKDTDWFSVWEGCCYYHSTLDVEYNHALFYLACWPQLLERLLDQWALFAVDGAETLGPKRGKKTAFLCHDMGSGGRVAQQHYPHAMEVEETANYLLLVHAHWRWTADDGPITRHVDLLRRLAAFLLKADTTGNGLPDRGVANTIDDATPALQFGREQVYLGFKTLAALEKTAEIAEFAGERKLAVRLHRRARKLRKTLDGKAWMVDHYTVTLSPDGQGVLDVWEGTEVPEKVLSGWDAYSIYAANGLLYPLLAGRPVEINRGRLRRDLQNAMERTLTEYGCTHTSDPGERVWLSQNLWRDFVAAYLDLNILHHADRYWAYQVLAGSSRPITCYYDTVGNNLCFYPRGIVSIGTMLAACRFQLDRVEGCCRVDPLSDHFNLPLLALARWDKRQVPRLLVRQKNGRRQVKVSYRNCLRGLEFIVESNEPND